MFSYCTYVGFMQLNTLISMLILHTLKQSAPHRFVPSTHISIYIHTYTYICMHVHTYVHMYKNIRTDARISIMPIGCHRAGTDRQAQAGHHNWTPLGSTHKCKHFLYIFLFDFFFAIRLPLWILIIIFMLRPSWLMTSSCKLKLEHKRQQTRKKLANFRLIFLSNLHVNLWCSPSSAVCLLHCAFFFFLDIARKVEMINFVKTV